MNVIQGKRAVLFSLLSLLLVITLVSVSSLLVDRQMFQGDSLAVLSEINRNDFLHHSISRSLLSSYNVSPAALISNSSNTSFMFFSNFGVIGDSVDISSQISSIESFIETNLSSATNTLLDISGNVNTIIASPYNFSATFSNLVIDSVISPTFLQAISFTAIVNVSDSSLLSDTFPSDSGNVNHPLISITLLDNTNAEINSTSVRLNPTLSNADFDWTFSDGSAQIFFGNSGELDFTVSGVTLQITNVTIELNETFANYVQIQANMTINEDKRLVNSN